MFQLVELPLLSQNSETLERSVETLAEITVLQKVALKETTITVRIATAARIANPSFILNRFVIFVFVYITRVTFSIITLFSTLNNSGKAGSPI
jgi:hypothetical protein